MKTSSCPNLNRETTSFPNFFTLSQDPDSHDNDTSTLNKRPKTDRGDDTTTLNKRPKIDRGDDTEASEASSFKDALSSFVLFDEMNEPGYLPNCWDQEDDQTLAKWPPSPNGSDINASVGSNQFNPEFPGIHRGASKMSESTFDFFLNELEPPRVEQSSGSLSSTQLHHMISERNGRKKLIESFHALQSLLPPLGTKTESLLDENFGAVKAKHSSEEARQRWRRVAGLVKNRKRKFRFTANLSNRYEAAAMCHRQSDQMESLLDENFGAVKAKHSSEEARQRWRRHRQSDQASWGFWHGLWRYLRDFFSLTSIGCYI